LGAMLLPDVGDEAMFCIAFGITCAAPFAPVPGGFDA